LKTATDLLTLTDDEAAALAATLDDPWRAPLPTVDLASRDDVRQAVLRGRRSLVVRDLAETDGTPAGLAAEVRKRLGTGLRAFFLLADDAGNWLRGGITVYLYGSSVDAVELSHVVAAAGVHYFTIEPPAGRWTSLAGLAEAIFADGFPDGAGGLGGVAAADRRPPAAALLHVVRPDGIRFIRITRGAVSTGRGPVPARFPSVPDAIAWLLALQVRVDIAGQAARENRPLAVSPVRSAIMVLCS
jgi:hypothetical protein